MKSKVFVSAVILILALPFSNVLAEVPQMINYQGKLTNTNGALINDTVDVIFSIYNDSVGPTPSWSETLSVEVENGTFSVLLGNIHPIPYSLFDGTVKYLGIKVEDDPEMAPRREMVTSSYAFRSLEADTADYARAGTGGGLNCHDCDSVFVNVVGPDSVLATSGKNAFTVKMSKSDPIIGNTRGSYTYAKNTSTGGAIGGYFETSPEGSGTHTGVQSWAFGSSTSWTRGVYGLAYSTGGGNSYGGSFEASGAGTGWRYGVYTLSSSASSNPSHGIYAFARNEGIGTAYGGKFMTDSLGTGTHYGVHVESYGSSSNTTYGYYAESENQSTGSAYGGYFYVPSAGTGTHYGVSANSYSNSASPSYGVRGYGSNTSFGYAYGGYFSTNTSGTGRHYGILAEGNGSFSSDTYGIYATAENTSVGSVYGGYFTTSSSGSGAHTGVYAKADGTDNNWYVAGILSGATNYGSDDAIGGFFGTTDDGTGDHYGVYAKGLGASSAPTYGVRGYGENTSTGSVYAGSFEADSAGSGTRIGVNAIARSRAGSSYGTYSYSRNTSSSASYGVYAQSYNTSTGSAYGGYFTASGLGTGSKYGIYAYGPLPADWAGWFQGDVGISNNLYVYGSTKSAAVKVDNGEYRLLYSQESTENWFEDFGEAQLARGTKTVNLDPLYFQTVNTNVTYHVFLTPGSDCNGLYVTNKTPTSFEVRELGNGNSTLTFSYRIVAKRRGSENVRLAKIKSPAKEAIDPEQQSSTMREDKMKMEEKRTRLEQRRIEKDREQLKEEEAHIEEANVEQRELR